MNLYNYILNLCNVCRSYFHQSSRKGKGKAVPVTGLEWPRGFQEVRFPDFTTTAEDGGKVVSLTHRPPLPL